MKVQFLDPYPHMTFDVMSPSYSSPQLDVTYSTIPSVLNIALLYDALVAHGEYSSFISCHNNCPYSPP